MLVPLGLDEYLITSHPISLKNWGAMSNTEPLAQSITTLILNFFVKIFLIFLLYNS